MNGGDDDLEARLHELATRATYPPTPPLALGARRIPSARHHPLRRSVILALAALLTAAATVVAAVVGLPGLRISFVAQLPTPNVASGPLDTRAALGERSSLAAVHAALGSDFLATPGLGEPAETYLGHSKVGGVRVALVFSATPDLPSISGDIGAIVTEWRGVLDDGFATKWVAQEGGVVESVSVAGAAAFWFNGTPHVFEYLDEINGIGRPTSRLVGDVLVWERNRVIYRIESHLGREATLAVAETMESARP